MSEHNWSGWPGAWCLDCGVKDISEEVIACPECDCGYLGSSETLCEKHQAMVVAQRECPEPGSNRFNPYVREHEAR